MGSSGETYLPDGIFQQLFGMSKADQLSICETLGTPQLENPCKLSLQILALCMCGIAKAKSLCFSSKKSVNILFAKNLHVLPQADFAKMPKWKKDGVW